MSQLVSPVKEFTLGSAAYGVAAVPLVVLGVALGPAVPALLDTVLATGLFGAIMYRWVYRPRLRDAVERLSPAPAIGPEPTGTTLRRGAVVAAMQAVPFTIIALAVWLAPFEDRRLFGLFAGFLAGLGLASLLMARWLRGWEDDRGVHLLASGGELHWPWRRPPQTVEPGKPRPGFVFYAAPVFPGCRTSR